jgi:hypothetical protein
MIGLIHWVQDYGRIGEEPTMVGIDNAKQLRTALVMSPNVPTSVG